MARNETEIETLPQGAKANSASHGPFLQNMFRRQDALETRMGWGQVGQFDSVLGASQANHGFQQVLGTIAFKTDFGNTQVVTILSITAFTGETPARGQWVTTYSVVIYDVTTRRSWEEVLHRHTSEQDPTATSPINYRGVFASNRDQDFSAYPQVSQPQRVWTVEYQDTIYFGAQTLGVWAYTPIDFCGTNIDQQLQGSLPRTWAPTYGDSPVVRPVTAVPGPVSAADAYLDLGGFPNATAASVIDERLVYAAGRSVFFTDPGYPGSIMATNILQIPCEDSISAIIEFSGNLMCFTPRETWLYQPNVGSVIANGRLTRVSGSVGCPSPYAVTRAGSTLFWLDARGAYTLKGLFDIDTASLDIKNLFDPHIGVPNPLSSYVIANGQTTTTNQQPRTFLYMDSAQAVMCYDSLYRQVLIGQPSENLCWSYQDGNWGMYAFETVVNDTNTVKATPTLTAPWPLALDGQVYGVCGTETYTPDDHASPPENHTSKSFYIVKQGHGGSLDRTVSASEDNRTIAGWMELQAPSSLSNGCFKLDRPLFAPTGYRFPNVITSATTMVYPIRVQASSLDIKNIRLRFTFDSDQWTPIFTDNTTSTYLDFIIPPDRAGSVAGWAQFSPTPNNNEAQCYDSGTGLPSRTGNEIRLSWDSIYCTAHSSWSWASMNLSPHRESLLMYLGFKKKTGTTTNTCMTLGATVSQARLYSNFGAGTYQEYAFYNWHQAYVPNLHAADDTAAPVDWCIKTDQIGLEGQDQIKTRGLYVHIVDHSVGTGTPALFPNWPASTYNVLGSGDMADYSGQIKDFGDPWTSTEHLVTKPTIRNRVLDSTGTLQPKVFGNAAVTWGDSATNSGNILIDDEALDTRAISSNVRGETVSWMNYGHIRSPSERVMLESIKAAIKDTGERKRRGR